MQSEAVATSPKCLHFRTRIGCPSVLVCVRVCLTKLSHCKSSENTSSEATLPFQRRFATQTHNLYKCLKGLHTKECTFNLQLLCHLQLARKPTLHKCLTARLTNQRYRRILSCTLNYIKSVIYLPLESVLYVCTLKYTHTHTSKQSLVDDLQQFKAIYTTSLFVAVAKARKYPTQCG